jgi:hypothetical protein
MTKSEYIRKIIQTRLIGNRHISEVEQKMLRVLTNAFDELSSLLQLSQKGTLTYANYASKQREIQNIIEKMIMNINSGIRTELKTTATEISRKYAVTAAEYASSYGLDISGSFSKVNIQAVNNVVSRVWSDGQTFSKRIWKLQKSAEYGVKDIITTGIARGRGVAEMERDLRAFLVDPKLAPGKRSVNWEATRLAKTEVNNTYRESQVISNDVNPITDGIHWNLAKSHTVPDICDAYAEANMFGKGAGNYPAKMTPVDHPNGNCFLTDNLRPVRDWNKPKEESGSPNIPDISQIERFSGLSEKSSNNIKKAIVGMFDSIQ